LFRWVHPVGRYTHELCHPTGIEPFLHLMARFEVLPIRTVVRLVGLAIGQCGNPP
jgi:hypothetical protein